MRARTATFLAVLASTTTIAFAQDAAAPADPFASRGASLSPILRFVQSQSVDMTSLGEVAGVDGYLIQSANGSFQVLYPTDDEHVVAGVLLRSGGDNVTSRQIGEMINRFGEAATREGREDLATVEPGESSPSAGPIVDWFRGQGLVITDIPQDHGGVDAIMVESPAEGDEPAKAQVFYVLPDAPDHAIAGLMLRNGGMNVTGLQIADLRQRMALERSTQEAGGSTISPTVRKPSAPPAAFPAGAEPTPPATGDATSFRLGDEAGTAVAEAMATSRHFRVGREGVPEIYMVADPNCPFCHETWRLLKPKVDAGEISLNVVMIAGLAGSDVKARSLVSRIESGAAATAWQAGEGSVGNVAVADGPMSGTDAWMKAGEELETNMGIMRRFGVAQTPFLVYVGADGKTYASTGIPSDMNVFLGATG